MDMSQLVIPSAGQKLQGSDFRDLCRPGVYVFMRRGKPLYIGMAKRMLGRIGSLHRQAESAIEECDEVLLYPCVSVKAAVELEIILIGKLKPTYNKQHKMFAAKLLGLSRA